MNVRVIRLAVFALVGLVVGQVGKMVADRYSISTFIAMPLTVVVAILVSCLVYKLNIHSKEDFEDGPAE